LTRSRAQLCKKLFAIRDLGMNSSGSVSMAERCARARAGFQVAVKRRPRLAVSPHHESGQVFNPRSMRPGSATSDRGRSDGRFIVSLPTAARGAHRHSDPSLRVSSLNSPHAVQVGETIAATSDNQRPASRSVPSIAIVLTLKGTSRSDRTNRSSCARQAELFELEARSAYSSDNPCTA